MDLFSFENIPQGAGPLRVSDRKRQVVFVRGRVLEDELVVVTSSNEDRFRTRSEARTRLLPGAFPALVTSTLAVMQYSPLFQCGSIRDDSVQHCGCQRTNARAT